MFFDPHVHAVSRTTDDYEAMAAHKWCYTNGYAARRAPGKEKNRHLYMHRVLCPAEDGTLVAPSEYLEIVVTRR